MEKLLESDREYIIFSSFLRASAGGSMYISCDHTHAHTACSTASQLACTHASSRIGVILITMFNIHCVVPYAISMHMASHHMYVHRLVTSVCMMCVRYD